MVNEFGLETVLKIAEKKMGIKKFQRNRKEKEIPMNRSKDKEGIYMEDLNYAIIPMKFADKKLYKPEDEKRK